MLNLRGARSGHLVRCTLAATATARPRLPRRPPPLPPRTRTSSSSRTRRSPRIRAASKAFRPPARWSPATSSRLTPRTGWTTARSCPTARRPSSPVFPGATPDVVESYRFAFAGFTAQLTADQADALKKDSSVAQRLEGHAAAADAGGGRSRHTARRLPRRRRLLPAPDRPDVGLWNQLGGPLAPQRRGLRRGRRRHRHRHPAQPPELSRPRQDGFIGKRYEPPAVWDGACQAGDGFPVTACNNKLVGARYYVDGFGRNNLDPKSHLSPRDDEGHGTHTASTAAGNYGVDPVIDGNDLGVDVISGISPRSYVAMYKVCWEGNGVTSAAGCSTADTVKAVDDAVADGVDVINYSVGTHVLDADQRRMRSPSSAPRTPASSSPTPPATRAPAPHGRLAGLGTVADHGRRRHAGARRSPRPSRSRARANSSRSWARRSPTRCPTRRSSTPPTR